jgi:HAD superfamily hydrolase (TIGR01509 family)
VSTFRFAGAIFDLDGTLVMSEHLHRQSWIEPLEELGITVDEDAYLRDFAGKPGMQTIRDHVGLEGDAAVSLYERVTNAYWQLAVELATPTAGVIDFLDQIAATPKSVCTSAQRDSALRMLDMLDLTRRFDAIVTATDVSHGKPDPEPFLLAAMRIGIDPGRCVAFEDSTNGLIAARAAGMTCIGIGPGTGASARLADGWIVDFTDLALSQLVME